MKKLMVSIAMLAFVLMAAPTWAQSSPTDKLFDSYGSQDGFTTVHISKELFSLFAEISQESDDAEVGLPNTARTTTMPAATLLRLLFMMRMDICCRCLDWTLVNRIISIFDFHVATDF